MQSIWDATALLSVLKPWTLCGRISRTIPPPDNPSPSLITIPSHQHPLLLRFSGVPSQKDEPGVNLESGFPSQKVTRSFQLGVSVPGSPLKSLRGHRREKEVENRTTEGLILALGRGLFLKDQRVKL